MPLLQRLLSSARRALPLAGAALLLAPAARATWSIVVVDRASGEVCVATATCIGAGWSIQEWVPVIVPGRGAGAAQANVDASATWRTRIWNGLHAGRSAARIVDELVADDAISSSKQYGVATLASPAAAWSGMFVGEAKEELTGEVGSLAYAIQGNVLAGNLVCWLAEEALVASDGDLSQRVMLAMEAAMVAGGDGRCSCSTVNPDKCGSPPRDFSKSAHVAYIGVARLGDPEGVCNLADGCANGDYWLSLEARTIAGEVDPVVELRRAYEAWRADLAGVPDHLESRVEPAATRLLADGVTSTEVLVRLIDVDGVPLSSGGQTLEVTYTGEDPPVAIAGPVTDLGDGTHRFTLTATSAPGEGRWRIVVRAGPAEVRLHPELVVPVDALHGLQLHPGLERLSAAEAPALPLVLHDPSFAGAPYHLLGSASGSSPGTPYRGLLVPLVSDRLYWMTWSAPGPPLLTGFRGRLDGAGRAEASFSLPSGALTPYIGRHLSFCAILAAASPELTEIATVEVVP